MTLTKINKAGLDELALDHVFTIGASGSSAYTFQGEGLNGTVNNPTLYLTRGKTYRFENGTGAHPIRIQSTSGASGTPYNTGVTNNAGSGTVIVEVQHDAPDVLYYQCTSHAAMNGILYITGALADGGVTTAKIADDAVTDAKLANSINSAIAANTAKVQTTINNNADNRVITGSNSANTLNAESNVIIDSSGNVGIGVTSVSRKLHVSGDILGNAFMLAGNTSPSPSIQAQIYRVADNTLAFATNGSNERMRIDSSGNVGIGTTSPAGKLAVSDGTVVGEINPFSGSSACFIGTRSNHDVILKCNAQEKVRIRAGGGLTFNGDTAAANALDDYEEGTYSPTASGQTASTNVNFYSNQNTLSYQKVGNTVTVHGRVRIENNNFTGGFRITLPFTAAASSQGSNNHQAFVATHGVDFDSSAGTGSHMALTLEVIPNDSYAYFLLTRDNTAWITADYTHIKADSYLAFQVIYKTN